MIAWRSTWSIYKRELLRFLRTAFQSVLAPVLTTSLYFIVFGAAIGSRMPDLGGVDYGAFIIPGLLMLTLLGETTSNSSFGIYMPRFTGTIYEYLTNLLESSVPPGVIAHLYKMRWDIEKSFDEVKNKLGEKKDYHSQIRSHK